MKNYRIKIVPMKGYNMYYAQRKTWIGWIGIDYKGYDVLLNGWSLTRDIAMDKINAHYQELGKPSPSKTQFEYISF